MNQTLKQTIGLRIRAARTGNGMTQEALAEAIERTVETVSNIERGQTLPTIDTLERFSRVLEIPLREFFPGILEGEEKPSRRRLELQMRLQELLRQLDERNLGMVVRLVEVVVEGREKG